MTLASSLRENKAVHTVAGAGDLAVEKLREVPEQMTRARENLDRYQDRAREAATRYQGDVRGTVGRYREQVREAVGRYRVEVTKVQDRVDTKELPGAAIAYVTHVGTRTVEFIDGLAERGRKVVHGEAAEITDGGSSRGA
ncbi:MULTISPECIES: hypothetical protein [Actinomadura]|uniref:Uncharacterized protein n=1 Tax=Actinomadura litoris TaxID=2678616 RepID=A0A7K1LCB4_9ACTN|nr:MULTISPECIES: hypothetical protein [Actinomadura]MBT2208224.1 hypothetical protein [Actinomadura sp. NEAU-AAG7]MUN42064.1 hypothetical protein [Actinomadura litoris]